MKQATRFSVVCLAGVLCLSLAACKPQSETTVPVPSKSPEEPEYTVTAGTPWYPDCAGDLIPYIGAWSPADETACVYGLMTRDGTAVTEPVFSAVRRPGYYAGQPGQTVYHTHPLLVLTRNEDGARRHAVAAADGSWCTGFDYLFCDSEQDGLLLFNSDGMVLMTPDGRIAETDSWDVLGIDDVQGFLDRIEWSWDFVGWYGDYVELAAEDNGKTRVCFRRSAGEWERLSVEDWSIIQLLQREDTYEVYKRADSTEVERDGVRYQIPHTTDGLAEVHGDLVIFASDGAVYTLAGEAVLAPMEDGYGEFIRDSLLGDGAPGIIRRYDRQTGQQHYYRTDGTPLSFLDPYSPYVTQQMGLSGGLVYTLDNDVAAYYDLNTLECVFRTNLNF